VGAADGGAGQRCAPRRSRAIGPAPGDGSRAHARGTGPLPHRCACYARPGRLRPFRFAVGAGVVAASARPTTASPWMHSSDSVTAHSEAASAHAVIGAAVAEGYNWLGGGSGAHSSGGGAGGGDVEELDVEGLGHATRS
jgi:hypothetical protein